MKTSSVCALCNLIVSGLGSRSLLSQLGAHVLLTGDSGYQGQVCRSPRLNSLLVIRAGLFHGSLSCCKNIKKALN
jgi:hypothetical protein